MTYRVTPNLHCVSKNEPTLASCSFVKHGLLLLILGKQHQHNFGNYMHIQHSSSLHFYLLCLLLNSCDGNDMANGDLKERIIDIWGSISQPVGQWKKRLYACVNTC